MNMVTAHVLRYLVLGTLLTVGHSATTISKDEVVAVVDKRDACKGVECREAPASAGTCTKVKGESSECCQDFECETSDGTKSKHSGMVSSSSYDKDTPDGGHVQGFSSSSSSSSSSGKIGPGGLKGMPPMPGFGKSDFGDFKPMTGGMATMLPMGDFGGMPSMPGFKPMKPMKPMEGMPPMPPMPGFKPMKGMATLLPMGDDFGGMPSMPPMKMGKK